MNDCLGTLVEIMLKRIEDLESRLSWIEEHGYCNSPNPFVTKREATHVATQTDVD